MREFSESLLRFMFAVAIGITIGIITYGGLFYVLSVWASNIDHIRYDYIDISRP